MAGSDWNVLGRVLGSLLSPLRSEGLLWSRELLWAHPERDTLLHAHARPTRTSDQAGPRAV